MDHDEAYRQENFVRPFYLKMMRLNALEYGAALKDALVNAGRDATTNDVVALLRSAWRERVMGGWLGVQKRDAKVTDAVLNALATSWGTLDCGLLAAAAVVLAGPAAMPSIERYYEVDQARGLGGSGIVTAAAAYVSEHHPESVSDLPLPTSQDRDAFSELVRLAEDLRSATP